MQTKRIAALMLALMMLISLTACGEKPNAADDYVNVPVADTTTPVVDEQTQTEVGQEPAEEEPVVNLRANGGSYLEYQVIVPGEGVGDHPSFQALTAAQEALASIGITLTIVDPQDSSELQAALASGGYDLWAAAWPTDVDPDLYPVYHSESVPGEGGTGSNYFNITDSVLDEKILLARGSDDQAQRRRLYLDCLDIIMGWAVEIPNYRRLSGVIFNSNTVRQGTVTPDMTLYWGWEREVEKLEMADSAAELVVATGNFTGQYNPWYAATAADLQAVELTQLFTLTTDRQGAVVFDAIEGETRSYNGTDYLYTGPADISVEYDASSDTTTYTITLREDITFADGSTATADDLIFSYYVLSDPGYTGPYSLAGYNILGFDDYRTQSTPEMYSKYSALFDTIYEAGRDAVYTDDTANAAAALWQAQEDVWIDSIRRIVDYVYSGYLNFASDVRYGGGFTAENISASEGLKVAYAMVLWGYGTWDSSGCLTTASGRVFDCKNGDCPTAADFYSETYLAYNGDIAAYAAVEDAYGTDLLTLVKRSFVSTMAAADPESDGGVPYISGITRVDDYTVQVVTQGYSASAIYAICDVPIAPMHYYSAVADDYDYEGSHFGVIYGDLLSTFDSDALAAPMGAGAYSFAGFEDGVMILAANEAYFRGAPLIGTLWLRETSSADVASDVAHGIADCGEIAGSRYAFEEIAGYNGSGELSGNAITTYLIGHYAYGYIGLNADTVCVNGEPDSDASRALRRAIATVIALYRDAANAEYYGDAAITAQYPLAGSSWASPQPYEPGYTQAYSTDLSGNPIYTDDMTFEEREAAALQAALEFLEAAGFVIEGGVAVAGPAAPVAE